MLKLYDGSDTTLLPGLVELLTDCVHQGASIGFLAPLPASTALHYWQTVLDELSAGLLLWVMTDGARVIGSVQLSLCKKENGLHRAEVQKLMLHSQYRGRGLATQLMAAVEIAAHAHQRNLLVLDTEAGSHAENVYRHLGWQRSGEIPEYALSPSGQMRGTAYYFKQLLRA